MTGPLLKIEALQGNGVLSNVIRLITLRKSTQDLIRKCFGATDIRHFSGQTAAAGVLLQLFLSVGHAFIRSRIQVIRFPI